MNKKLFVAVMATTLGFSAQTWAEDKSTQEGQTSERYNQNSGASLPAADAQIKSSGQSSGVSGEIITESAGAQTPQNGSLSKEDSKFVHEAAAGGAMEVEMGKLGVEKGQSAGVKEFAQRLVDDHTKANEELKQIAQEKGIQLSSGEDKESNKMTEHLQGLSGAEFDRAYVKHMIQDHKKDIKAFEKAASSGKDSQIKEFASKTLPTLQQHLATAQSLSTTTAGSEVEEPAGASQDSQSKSDGSSSEKDSQPASPQPDSQTNP